MWALGKMLRAVGEKDSARRGMQQLEGVGPGYDVHADLGLLLAEAGDGAGALCYDSLLARPAPGLPVFDAALGVPVPLDSVHVPAPFR